MRPAPLHRILSHILSHRGPRRAPPLLRPHLPVPSPQPSELARLIEEGHQRYHARFEDVTARAAERFAARDWRGGADDDRARLALYEQVVQRTLRHVRALAGPRVEDRALWAEARAAYADRIEGQLNRELAETFYNSVTRRVFATVGVDPAIEFVAEGLTEPGSMEAAECFTTLPPAADTPALVRAVLGCYDLGVPFHDLDRDARRVAERIEACLAEHGASTVERAEMLRPVFYRNKGAYLIGRLWAGGTLIPLVLPILHAEDGLRVDTALLTPNAASMVFSFTRSYFHACCAQPWALVSFLKTLMPGSGSPSSTSPSATRNTARPSSTVTSAPTSRPPPSRSSRPRARRAW
jgi:isocitrate dehydrogenase kinase/phosphatase